MHVQTLEDVMMPYRHLPKTIQQSLLRVETHPTFRALTKATLKVLKALVTRASETNGEREIRARLDRVADEAGVSTKTVQRSMATLKMFGWISPVTEGRSEFGVFCSRRYTFTSSFCELVNLPTKSRTVAMIAQGTEMSDGAYIDDLNFKKDQREISLKNGSQKPIELPPALVAMAKETQILESGIAKLRGIAHGFGHKLEHVYSVARNKLSEHSATGARAYRYILAMLFNPRSTDYAARAAQQERILQEVTAATLTKSRAAKYFNKKFQVRPGVTLSILRDEARLDFESGNVKIIPYRDLGQVFDDIEDGKFQEIIRLDQATRAAETARVDSKVLPQVSKLDDVKAAADLELSLQLKQRALPQGAAANIAAARAILKTKNFVPIVDDGYTRDHSEVPRTFSKFALGVGDTDQK